MTPPIDIQPTLHKTHGRCPCCGGVMQSVWGWIHRGSGPRALYFVRWVVGHSDAVTTWFLSVGRWDAYATPHRRRAVALAATCAAGYPAFEYIDAGETPWASCRDDGYYGALLSPAQVGADAPLHDEVSAYIEAVLAADERVRRFLESGEGMNGQRPRALAAR